LKYLRPQIAAQGRTSRFGSPFEMGLARCWWRRPAQRPKTDIARWVEVAREPRNPGRTFQPSERSPLGFSRLRSPYSYEYSAELTGP